MSAQKLQSSFITSTEAAAMANVTRETIINWCDKYGIGYKFVGRWRIDLDKFTKFLERK